MTTAKLPTLALPVDLHAALVVEAARRDCAPADLVSGVIAELVELLAAEALPHRPTRFCRCGGGGCASTENSPAESR